MPFIPHTEDDVAAMLGAIGAPDIEALFDEIPPALRTPGLAGVGAGLTEAEVTRLMNERAAQDRPPVCFLGAGAYEHHIPAAVWELATRGEFYSAYTPYQAEASQGTLQLIYEFQSMMASLMALDISNASLYDGATAFAEACLMAVRANRKSTSRRVLTTRCLSPAYRSVARTILGGQGIELAELPLDGCHTSAEALCTIEGDFAALAIQQPNFLGALEAVDELTDAAHARDMLVIGCCDPIAAALLRPPGHWGATGADIACGEGQPLGIPLSSGGPYFGFLVCRAALVRQMPGRIVGRTLDVDGRPGFTLTLQAREQHIRRSRATSNICTNQGLMVTAATIHLSLLGAEGLRRTAAECHANTRELVGRLTRLPGVRRAADEPFFQEAVLVLDRPVAPVLDALAVRGILGGYDLSADYPELGEALLVCATEMRTGEDIAAYAAALEGVLGVSSAVAAARRSR